MALFKKARRHVGDFVPPKPAPLAPLDEVVEDALTVAYYGVRMAVKNRLIVNALRDGRAFDQKELEEFAMAEYASLAATNREQADAAQVQLARDKHATEGRVFPGGKPVVVDEDHKRKPQVLRAVADAYETTAVEASALAKLIDEAKVAAWDEIGGTLTKRLTVPRVDEDPDYAAFRDERIARLIYEDLAALTSTDRTDQTDRAE